jgi:hypothetical protein
MNIETLTSKAHPSSFRWAFELMNYHVTNPTNGRGSRKFSGWEGWLASALLFFESLSFYQSGGKPPFPT